MNNIIAFAKLPFLFDELKLQQEVVMQMSKEISHFNTAQYTGEWTAIALRSPEGKASNIIPDARTEAAFEDTVHMDECPAIKAVVHSLQCPVMSVRLLNLKIGAAIKEHRDVELSFEKGEARLHIPVFTNKQVEFYVDGSKLVMQEGECWYINANLRHRVSNFGQSDRIHLVIDCSVNEWLKGVFSAADKTYSTPDNNSDQTRLVIRELRLQNTATSHQLADQLEEQLKIVPIRDKPIFPYWLPYKVALQKNEVLLHWLYVNEHRFTEPFFDDTIAKCKRLPENSTRFNSVSNLSIGQEWADNIERVEPSAFIFHVSRCGSTLVSQMLSMKDENISLSEVPVFDQILQIPLKTEVDEQPAHEALKAAIKLYGGKRTGKENHLFIKTDSWHLLFYRQLRALYPSTPFVILYRNPTEVLHSQQRKKGMHAVYGVVEPAVFGFNEDELKRFDADNYMALVLEKYFAAIAEIGKKDKNVLLVNYEEGIITIMQKISEFTGMEITENDHNMFLERSKFYSKDAREVFAEKAVAQSMAAPNIDTLTELYEQIEELRRNS